MRSPREWLRSLLSRLSTSSQWLITKVRRTSKSTRIAIGIALVIIYWLYPAGADTHRGGSTPELDPMSAGGALVVLAGILFLLDGRLRR